MDDVKSEMEEAVRIFAKTDVTTSDMVLGFASLGQSMMSLGWQANQCNSKLQRTKEMQVFIEMTRKFATLQDPRLISLEIG